MMTDALANLMILFTISFLAAAVLPAQSEAVLAGLYLSSNYNPALLIVTATAGNALGSCVNWLLGRYLMHFKDRRWFPVTPVQMERAIHIFQRFGVWTLLFAWVPFIGDPLTLIAGFLRTNLLLFAALVTAGKAARYMAVVAAL